MNVSLRRLAAVLVLLVALFVAAQPATAQQPAPDVAPDETMMRPLNVSGQLSFLVGLPQGRFADQVESTGFGGSFTLFADLGRSPLKLGAEFGGMIYGSERRREPLSTTIPDVTVRVETTNNIGLGHLILRLAPETGRVAPYVDGLFGAKYLFTQTNIQNDQTFDQVPVLASTNFDDLALSYGIGGGVGIELYRGVVGPRRIGAVQLDLGLRYLFGGEAEYLKRGSIRRVNGQVEYDVLRSRTDLLIPQVGFSVRL